TVAAGLPGLPRTRCRRGSVGARPDRNARRENAYCAVKKSVLHRGLSGEYLVWRDGASPNKQGVVPAGSSKASTFSTKADPSGECCACEHATLGSVRTNPNCGAHALWRAESARSVLLVARGLDRLPFAEFGWWYLPLHLARPILNPLISSQ